MLESGTQASLSEDNGAYVFSQPLASSLPLPAADTFRLGATTAINGKSYTVASNAEVSVLSAQGELPRLPAAGRPFAMVELRSADGEVLSIDYGPALAGDGALPALSQGRSVQLDDLVLTGLRDDAGTDVKGSRQLACPNCGASVKVALASSKAITCSACNSLIDLSHGIGADLTAAVQDEPVSPLIALGTTGLLQGASWQVVGFQHRMGHAPGDDDESFGWDEYLLYHRKRGFCFLVDATDGWSLVKPVTGAPSYKAGAQTATYLATSYRLLSSYQAETSYVAGEFYWQVSRGQKTFNSDFANGKSLLSQETAGSEVTWSSGNKLDGDAVAAAFKLDGKKALFKRSDAGPLSSASGMGLGTIAVGMVLIVLLLIIISRCSRCDPARENCGTSSSARSAGGAYGGYAGGGGHK